MSDIYFSDTGEGRYDRHELIPWWDQSKVAAAHIIVAGAGALGNEALKLLALIGVGQVTVIDFDVISRSNLTRMVLFREEDIGRPKVAVAAQRLAEINPQVRVHAVQDDLRFALGLGEYRSASVVLGCLDSVHARWALNRKCQQAGVEWIDGGISDFHGLVARYAPGQGACYECNFTPRTLERFNRRYSCPFGLVSGEESEKVPTTAVTTSVIAAIQVQQALMQIHAIDEGLKPGERLTVYLKPFHMVKDVLPANLDCLAHDPYPAQVPAVDYSPVMTAVQAIAIAQANTLCLPFELVVEFDCPGCGAQESLRKPKERVLHQEAACPRCGALRTPQVISEIDVDSAYAGLDFSQLALPPREILRFRAGAREVYLQFGR